VVGGLRDAPGHAGSPAALHLDPTCGTGWAVPTATDIAFVLAVLAVISTHLPAALRTFLLTLAIIDGLLAITIIAAFFTATLAIPPLLLALVPLAAFGFLVQRRVRSWWLLLPLAAVAWVLLHQSGVHATVAGVLLAFTVPVVRGLGAALSDFVAIGIVVGLLAAKPIGITAATWLVSRFARAELDSHLGWPDIIGLSLLAGSGVHRLAADR
jgi:NhaA family Na+:H+ antiporter